MEPVYWPVNIPRCSYVGCYADLFDKTIYCHAHLCHYCKDYHFYRKSGTYPIKDEFDEACAECLRARPELKCLTLGCLRSRRMKSKEFVFGYCTNIACSKKKIKQRTKPIKPVAKTDDMYDIEFKQPPARKAKDSWY